MNASLKANKESVITLNRLCNQKKVSFHLNYGLFSENPLIEKFIQTFSVKDIEKKLITNHFNLERDFNKTYLRISVTLKEKKEEFLLVQSKYKIQEAVNSDTSPIPTSLMATESLFVEVNRELITLEEFLKIHGVNDTFSEIEEWVHYLDIFKLAEGLNKK